MNNECLYILFLQNKTKSDNKKRMIKFTLSLCLVIHVITAAPSADHVCYPWILDGRTLVAASLATCSTGICLRMRSLRFAHKFIKNRQLNLRGGIVVFAFSADTGCERAQNADCDAVWPRTDTLNLGGTGGVVHHRLLSIPFNLSQFPAALGSPGVNMPIDGWIIKFEVDGHFGDQCDPLAALENRSNIECDFVIGVADAKETVFAISRGADFSDTLPPFTNGTTSDVIYPWSCVTMLVYWVLFLFGCVICSCCHIYIFLVPCRLRTC
jgi:hypothetical protein